MDLVQAMYAKLDTEAAAKAEEEAARDEAKNYLLHGMTKEQVEQVMTEIFQKSDADGSGSLSLQEFKKCCQDADIGLSRKEINILMHQCDVDGDGTISYEEFVPLCFEMLTEILKDELLQEKRTPTELEVFLTQVFAEADYEQVGMLSPMQIREVLRSADLGLSRLQIHSVLAEAEVDDAGMIMYSKYAPKAAEFIYRVLDMDAQLERKEAIDRLTGVDFSLVHGLDAAGVEATLMEELSKADSGSGLISMPDVQAILSSSSLGLSPNEVSAIMSSAELVEGNMVVYASLASYAYYILQYLAESAAAGY